MKRVLAFCLFLSVLLMLCQACDEATTPPSSEPTASLPSTSVTTSTTVATTTTTSAAPTTTTTRRTDTPTKGDPFVPSQQRTDGFAFTDEQIQNLNQRLNSYSGNVSVGLCDISSGYTYVFNGEKSYFAASLMKEPFCLYILQKAARGECDLSKELVYTKSFYAGGTGKIRYQPVGGKYTIQTLVEYAIRYSDNIALRLLRNEFGTEEFTKTAAQWGISNTAGIRLLTNSNIRVEDALVYMKETYRFLAEDNEYSRLFHTYLTSTTNPMITSKYTLARKYGWATASFHDMALVEAPCTYALVILSDREDGTGSDFAMFRQISAMFEEIAG